MTTSSFALTISGVLLCLLHMFRLQVSKYFKLIFLHSTALPTKNEYNLAMQDYQGSCYNKRHTKLRFVSLDWQCLD